MLKFAHFLVCFSLLCVGVARADLITFQLPGLTEGAPVPSIRGITFNAAIAVQGGPAYAFGTNTGLLDSTSGAPFVNPGNIFITNPGGLTSPDLVKVVEVFFPQSVTSLSFLVADIDSAPGVIIEHVLAEAFDASGRLLATRSFTAPTAGDLGDGNVILIDFGGLRDIRRLRISNAPVFNPGNRPEIGWGVDDLSFEWQPDQATSELTLGASASKVWANGKRTVELMVRYVDAGGNPLAGKAVVVTSDPSTAKINGTSGLASALTDGQGRAVFTATSTEISKVKFRARDLGDPTKNAETQVEFTPKKIAILALGVNTQLICGQSGTDCIANDPSDDYDNTFSTIRSTLLTRGFVPEEITWFSYRGGTPDATSGRWIPRGYACRNTAQDFRVTLINLRSQLLDFTDANPNSEIYVIGHSQGGLVGFQTLGFLDQLNRKPGQTSSVAAVITLDSPLGGVPILHLLGAWVQAAYLPEDRRCWYPPNGAAPLQMFQLYQTNSNTARGAQGTLASLLCSLPGIGLCTPQTNASAVESAARQGTVTFSFGNRMDALYYPAACPIVRVPRFGFSIDNTSTQVVISPSSKGGLGSYGSPSGSLADCVPRSHGQVFTSLAESVADILGTQY